MVIRNWSANVSMVYWIAKAMGHAKPTHSEASRMANAFTFQELNRIYISVKRAQAPDATTLVELITTDDETTLKIAA